MTRKRTFSQKAAVAGRRISRKIEKEAKVTTQKLSRIAERAMEEAGEVSQTSIDAATAAVRSVGRIAGVLPCLKRETDRVAPPVEGTVRIDSEGDDRPLFIPPHGTSLSINPRRHTPLEARGRHAGDGGLRLLHQKTV